MPASDLGLHAYPDHAGWLMNKAVARRRPYRTTEGKTEPVLIPEFNWLNREVFLVLVRRSQRFSDQPFPQQHLLLPGLPDLVGSPH